MNKLGLPENAEALGGIPRWLIKLGLPELAEALGGIPRGAEKGRGEQKIGFDQFDNKNAVGTIAFDQPGPRSGKACGFSPLVR